ncbi:putative GATA transcription factor 22 isoform X1 [Iris pallida]|uniref:GATA transcription factor 22 isoform X1 n=1 Tax=Iris pallida TaxID=29817 RepID=A0AAX6GVQ7_IRIPA|nr:putative GATA transcription factor 22 isoform X1 [Iris pallida]
MATATVRPPAESPSESVPIAARRRRLCGGVALKAPVSLQCLRNQANESKACDESSSSSKWWTGPGRCSQESGEEGEIRSGRSFEEKVQGCSGREGCCHFVNGSIMWPHPWLIILGSFSFSLAFFLFLFLSPSLES